ncbi:IS66 family transposase, partial [Eubacterium maltosivorans]|uniref:IS66 family transposase n=1 Tax=Eubacterium maltosivorans TaxID=2041044 RepID=UPI003A8D38E4
MPAKSRENPLTKTGNFDAFFREKYLTKNKRQIVLYEYQQTRNASHPREFLKGYDGICVTDGYQVYHTLEKELEELT